MPCDFRASSRVAARRSALLSGCEPGSVSIMAQSYHADSSRPASAARAFPTTGGAGRLVTTERCSERPEGAAIALGGVIPRLLRNRLAKPVKDKRHQRKRRPCFFLHRAVPQF